MANASDTPPPPPPPIPNIGLPEIGPPRTAGEAPKETFWSFVRSLFRTK